ncbi:MAG: aspartate--ammonia ligase [Vicingaceae bacterium]
MKTEVLSTKNQTNLDLISTEKAVFKVKEIFQKNLSKNLNLFKVTAPIIVENGRGINDDLNGIENPVAFYIKDLPQKKFEIVHSLAKWKRIKLAQLKLHAGEGIYVEMNALRPDEKLSNIHSVFVDQWDWEKVITKEDRSVKFLKATVEKIYDTFKLTEEQLTEEFKTFSKQLPDKVTFIYAEDLAKAFPELTSKQREEVVAKKYKAVFIMGIGGKLFDGKKHDGRAPDYDDWSSLNEEGYFGLNGDLIFWNEILQIPFEVSSMGIRVDKYALIHQLKLEGKLDRLDLAFHQKILNDELPLTIGGGIGQSRTCMFFLQKRHIGEVQSSVWPESLINECKANGINLL